MTTAQEQYADIVKQSQDAVLTAVGTWTKTIQDTVGQLPTSVPIDPSEAVDQVFAFAGKLLAAQHDFAKHLVATSSSAANSMRQATARVTETAQQN
jgi:hypothetical protein